MNMSKVLDALDALRAALLAEPPAPPAWPAWPPSQADWAEFGQAVAEALQDNYVIDGIVGAREHNPKWRPSGTRLWSAAGRAGIRKLT